MRLYNVIGMWALLLAAQPLAAAVSPDSSTVSPATTSPQPQTAYVPIFTHQAGLVYPRRPLLEGVEGDVTVCFTVYANGSVGNAHVTKGKFWTANGRTPSHFGEHDLKEEAVREMRQSTFVPRRVNGKAVTTPHVCAVKQFWQGAQQPNGMG